MNSLEWAVRDGVPYAIDFINPAPDMDINSLTPFYFDWVVKHMADMAIRLAKSAPQNRELRWDTLLTAERNRGEEDDQQQAIPPSNKQGDIYVIARSIQSYHELLTDELASESQAKSMIQHAVRELTFGGRPLCTVLRLAS